MFSHRVITDQHIGLWLAECSNQVHMFKVIIAALDQTLAIAVIEPGGIELKYNEANLLIEAIVTPKRIDFLNSPFKQTDKKEPTKTFIWKRERPDKNEFEGTRIRFISCPELIPIPDPTP